MISLGDSSLNWQSRRQKVGDRPLLSVSNFVQLYFNPATVKMLSNLKYRPNLGTPVSVPSLASVYNEYALKSQFETSIYLQVSLVYDCYWFLAKVRIKDFLLCIFLWFKWYPNSYQF
ncbi:hypothetical protein GW17_00030676 [Ensete ventricosum]|nr:hypothetical protein GW17_00030676 [Ensete ventricosum]